MSAVSATVPTGADAPFLDAVFAADVTSSPRSRTLAWRWAAYDVGAWALVSVLFALQAATRSPEPFARILAVNVMSFVPCAIFTPLIAFVTLRYRGATGDRGRTIAAHALCLGAFLTIGSIMMGALEWSLPWVPYGTGPWPAMRHAIVAYFAIDTLIYGLVAMAVLSFAYGRESRIRALRAARLQTQLAEAQLHALGAQLQPHFLFNTLHMISALVRHDPKRAEQLIARLSELLREMLDNGERVEISLAEELAFLEKYIEIQEARFGPRLQVHFEIAPSVRSARVPRLVLQPLLENAIRHGIARRSEPGTVVIGAAITDGLLVLTVRDDGVGVPQGGPVREGVGLSSTRARLLQLYGSASRFTIAPADGGGTLCTIHIPCFGADGASA